MKSEKAGVSQKLDAFAKKFFPQRKKFSLQETQLLADILGNSTKRVNFQKVKELAMTFFPDKHELDSQEAQVLSHFLLCGWPTKTQQKKIAHFFEGQMHCTVTQLIDIINAVNPDPASKLYRPTMGTDGNGNLLSTYVFEQREDCHFLLGKDGIAEVLREYYW